MPHAGFPLRLTATPLCHQAFASKTDRLLQSSGEVAGLTRTDGWSVQNRESGKIVATNGPGQSTTQVEAAIRLACRGWPTNDWHSFTGRG